MSGLHGIERRRAQWIRNGSKYYRAMLHEPGGGVRHIGNAHYHGPFLTIRMADGHMSMQHFI
jgi:hypothetical protein